MLHRDGYGTDTDTGAGTGNGKTYKTGMTHIYI